MTDKQHEVLIKLSEAWNLFTKIPKDEVHKSDPDEFCKAIHAAQNIMLAQLYIKQNGTVNMNTGNVEELIILNKGREKLYQKED